MAETLGKVQSQLEDDISESRRVLPRR